MKRLLLLGLLSLLVAAQAQDRTEVQLQAAIKMEVFDGNLKAAIEQYKKIINSGTASRAVKAKALLQLAGCYEKQGNADARKTLELIVRDYKDQTDEASKALERLSHLGSMPDATGGRELTLRKLSLDNSLVSVEGPPSPDGRYIAYADKQGDVSIYSVVTETSRKVTHRAANEEGRASTTAWSQDGTRIAYTYRIPNGDSDLRIVNLDGSNQRVVFSQKDTQIQLHAWFPDSRTLLGSIMSGNKSYQLVRISIADGSFRIIKPWGTRSVPDLALSPDGRCVAYSSIFDQKPDLVTFSIEGGNETRLNQTAETITLIGWDPAGSSILFTSDIGVSRDLWRININNGLPQGEAELLKKDIGFIWPLGITQGGSLFYDTYIQQNDIYVSALDLINNKTTLPMSRINPNHLGSSYAPAFSPDGESIAYLAISRPGSGCNVLCILSLKDGRQRELKLGMSLRADPDHISWSPDGQFIYGINGAENLVRINTLTGAVNIAGTVPKSTVIAWSPDGRTIIAIPTRTSSSDAYDLIAQDSQSGRQQELYRLNGSLPMYGFSWVGEPVSPDGIWMVVTSHRPSEQNPKIVTLETLAIPLNGDLRQTRKLVSANSPVRFASWAPDSKSILLWENNQLLQVFLERDSPRKLDKIELKSNTQIAFHPDGRQIAVSLATRYLEYWSMDNLPLPKSIGK